MVGSLDRRSFLGSLAPLLAVPATLAASTAQERRLRVTSMETIVVRATERTNWIFVRLHTNQGLSGLGEASLGRRTELAPLGRFFGLVRDRSPFDIERYRREGLATAAAGDRGVATAFSAIEQAQWDLVGKALDAPVYELFGGRLRDELGVYANINRATSDRTPDGFASNARLAVLDGFEALKAAPFDGFPPATAEQTERDAATELGIACVEAMRAAVGPQVAIKIDCHSFFDVELAVEVARRLEPEDLSWYEEPVPPQRVEETRAIRDAISQPVAGGEFLFGMAGFAPLIERRSVDVIMPDVKHCGGLQEARNIAALAELHGVAVSPHNPSGPVATAASVHLCAGMPNFDVLEFQWGEVDWRADLVDPPERFDRGRIALSGRPGLGVELNDALAREYRA